MSQNKYMHPRNIYKNPPNFKHLAISYPEFRKFTKQDIKGKVTFDFKNPEALKALTTTLLQRDFGLQVEIPSSRLVPTLPLRLNYLLWMEDLIRFLNKPREEETTGVDIGYHEDGDCRGFQHVNEFLQDVALSLSKRQCCL